MRRGTYVVAVLALIALPACIDDLPSGALLERPRVLGARLVVDADPSRAWPAPEEAARLAFFTAPRATPWAYALAGCVSAPQVGGIAGCAGDPFAVGAAPSSTDEPAFAFGVPPQSTLRPGATLLFAGVFCANGTPSVTPDETTGLPTCDGDDATTEVVTFSLPVAMPPTPANLHPELEDDAILLDDAAWPPSAEDPPVSGCASTVGEASFPRVTRTDAESPSRVSFAIDPSYREAYQELVFGETPMLVDARETLTLTHIADAGRVTRLTTEVFDDETVPFVEWEHPAAEDVPSDGLTVRFVFVVRDGRGGMARATRAACVVP
ncbi:MAG: hypothetical protein AB7S26_21970 [Sandaracinaceae bacterium]